MPCTADRQVSPARDRARGADRAGRNDPTGLQGRTVWPVGQNRQQMGDGGQWAAENIGSLSRFNEEREGRVLSAKESIRSS